MGRSQTVADHFPPAVGQRLRQPQGCATRRIGEGGLGAGPAGLPGEGVGAGQQLVSEHAEGPHIPGHADRDPGLRDALAPPFRRGVVGRGQARRAAVRTVDLDRQTEVRQPGRTIRHDEHIAGFKVAVDPAVRVHVGQALAHLDEDADPVRQRGARRRVGCRGAEGCCGTEGCRGVEQVDQIAGGPLHGQHHRAMQVGSVGIVDGQDGERADQPGVGGDPDQRRLAQRTGPQLRALPGRQPGNRQELQRNLGAGLAWPALARPAPG